MKPFNRLLSLAALLALAFSFAACTPEDVLDIFDDDDDNKTEYIFSVTPNGTVTFPAEGGSVEFKITTNAPIYGRVIDQADWISAIFDKSKSFNCIVITLAENSTNQERRTVVTFYAQEESSDKHVKEVKVTLVQPALTGELPSMDLNGTIDFGANINTAGYTVVTILDEQPVDGKSFTATAVPSADLPQPVVVCNASGDVVMMSREPYTEGDKAKIDARSTALALATMYPLFAPVKGAYEVNMMKTMFLGATTWNAFEEEVAKLIRAGKPILDSRNTGMKEALNALFDEVCVEQPVYPMTRADQPTKVYGSNNERPFKMEISGHTVKFFSYALTPMYEGKLYAALSLPGEEPVATLDIPAGTSYGVTDLYSRWGKLTWFEAATFNFDTLPETAGEGEFIFDFSRVSDKAQLDFAVNFFCDMLDIVGAGLGTIGTNKVKQAVAKWMTQRGVSITQMIMSGQYTTPEFFEFIFTGIQDFLTSKEFVEVAGVLASASAKALAKKLSPVTTVYSLIRGSSNTIMRAHFRLSTPEHVTIHLCYQEAFPLNACNFVTLEVVSGNNQQGLSNEYLEKPVRIRVNTKGVENASSSYYLRFSVEDGSGGEPMDEMVYTFDLEGETFWQLGDQMREQHMIVEALDFATGQVVSAQPLELTAVATDINETTKAPIPEVLQGKWVQKEGTYTGEPIVVELHKYKASFHDPKHASFDFTSRDVWYKPEVFFDGGMYNMVYFDETDSSTGQYKIFLKGTSVSGSTLYVTDMYGPTGYCELVSEDGGAYAIVSPSEMTFTADGDTQEAKITQAGYKKFGVVVDKKYEDWLSAQPVKGGIIQVTAQPNTSTEPRKGAVEWWVSTSDNPTEDQREYQTPIEITQKGNENGTSARVVSGDCNVSIRCKAVWYNPTNEKKDTVERLLRWNCPFGQNDSQISGGTVYHQSSYSDGSGSEESTLSFTAGGISSLPNGTVSVSNLHCTKKITRSNSVEIYEISVGNLEQSGPIQTFDNAFNVGCAVEGVNINPSVKYSKYYNGSLLESYYKIIPDAENGVYVSLGIWK